MNVVWLLQCQELYYINALQTGALLLTWRLIYKKAEHIIFIALLSQHSDCTDWKMRPSQRKKSNWINTQHDLWKTHIEVTKPQGNGTFAKIIVLLLQWNLNPIYNEVNGFSPTTLKLLESEEQCIHRSRSTFFFTGIQVVIDLLKVRTEENSISLQQDT